MSAQSSARAAPPGPVTCTALLLGMRVALRLTGFGTTVALAKRLAAPHCAGAVDARAVDSAARAVAVAAAFFPGRAICLEQALTLFVLLRRRGVAVELQVGVQPYPFAAHAWVELGGRPINEDEEVVRQFVPVPGLDR